MPNRDWDKELAKIDSKLESISDEQMFPSSEAGSPTERAKVVAIQKKTSTLAAVGRLLLATALGIGIMFWPYSAKCGGGLAGYLAAVSVLGVAGVWSAVWTWRHRTARAHLLSLLLVLWAIVLGAVEILPRAGYAKPTIDHPTGWTCQ
jgi:hypothetical protein